MDTYKLKGFYAYSGLPSGKGELEGEIEVATNGAFEGEVIDHGSSRAPNQLIKGHLYNFGGIDCLDFLKFPNHTNLANLAYSLTKQMDANSIKGVYTGRWGALPYKITYDSDKTLFLAEIDLNVVNVGDIAEIALRKK